MEAMDVFEKFLISNMTFLGRGNHLKQYRNREGARRWGKQLWEFPVPSFGMLLKSIHTHTQAFLSLLDFPGNVPITEVSRLLPKFQLNSYL